MVLLGIDPGLASTGFGVVEVVHSRASWRAHGCLRTQASQELGARLGSIYDRLLALVCEHRPEALAMERLYQLRDGSTGLAVGQAIGVIRLVAQQQGLPVYEYSPTHVKMTLVGYGQADKLQVQFMVQRLLGLAEVPRPDHAADALALCLCHAQSGLSRARLPQQHAGAGPAAARIAAALEAEEVRRRAVAEAQAAGEATARAAGPRAAAPLQAESGPAAVRAGGEPARGPVGREQEGAR